LTDGGKSGLGLKAQLHAGKYMAAESRQRSFHRPERRFFTSALSVGGNKMSQASPVQSVADSLAPRLSDFQGQFEYRFVVNYLKKPSNILAQLCEKHGSDKGALKPTGHPYPWEPMTYADLYLLLFHHCRARVKRVFECGIGTDNPDMPSSMGINGKPGASLRVWRDYFPNALIVGADIDRAVLFQEERIQTYYVDQFDKISIKALWEQIDGQDFDLMIDDGLHTFDAGRCMFENSIFRLSEEGIYVIEDVHIDEMFHYKDFFSEKGYIVNYVNLYRPREDSADNNAIVIRRP
jgi:hypothetical protein